MRGRLGVAAEQGAYLGLAESAMPARSADARDPPGGGPAGDCLRVDPEQGRYFSWSEKALVVAVHVSVPSDLSPSSPGQVSL